MASDSVSPWRALAADPDVLVADEPTSGLDVLAQEHLVDLVTAERASRGLTVVLVTHDLRIARRVADRVVVLEHGRIVADVSTGELARSTQAVTRELLDAAGPT